MKVSAASITGDNIDLPLPDADDSSGYRIVLHGLGGGRRGEGGGGFGREGGGEVGTSYFSNRSCVPDALMTARRFTAFVVAKETPR